MTRDLFVLLLRQIGAAPLFVEHDRFAPLLDHPLQHARDVGVGQSLEIALPAGGDVALL